MKLLYLFGNSAFKIIKTIVFIIIGLYFAVIILSELL